MYLSKELATFLSAFLVWGFLMTFFYNVMIAFLTDSVRKRLSLIIVSGIMFASYYTSDHFFVLFPDSNYYLTFFSYDAVTVTLIGFSMCFFKTRSPAPHYIVIGLSINAVLFLSMYIDLSVIGNRDSWWFWGLYSSTVNIVDYVMIITLIIDKDWLGLVRLGRFIRDSIFVRKSRLKFKAEEHQNEKQMPHNMLQA